MQSCDGVHTGACRLKNGAGTSCGMTCGQLQHCDDEGGCGLPHELQCPSNCSTSPRETTAPPSWFDALFVVAAAALLARTRRPSR